MKNSAKKAVSIVLSFIMLLSLAVIPNGPAKVSAAETQSGLSCSADYVISWDAVAGASGYRVYAADSRYAAYSPVETVSGTSYSGQAGKYYKIAAIVNGAEQAQSQPISREIDLFGYNTYIFETTDDNAAIQQVANDVFAEQETNQFGSSRYSLLFKKGNYSDDLRVTVGFYTQVAGLGLLPSDTRIGQLDANANWMWAPDSSGFNATCNFWRSAANMTVNSTTTWAVSQATSLRRMKFNGALAVDQWGQGWASGGFLADIQCDGLFAYSQQQWFSRNSDVKTWSGGVWNAVFTGMEPGITIPGLGNLENNWDKVDYQYCTVVDNTPVMRETPYLVCDDNDNFCVFVPSVMRDYNGVSWKNGAVGTLRSIDEFYVAKPEKDTAATINAALASGKSLILAPGIYSLNEAIRVTRPNTVVLGLGYATLTPAGNNACIEIADVDGVSVSGLLFDAGPAYTETLLKVGPSKTGVSHYNNPILLSDLFFRVGGATSSVVQSETCIIVNANDTIIDNFWVWRADHGAGVAWDLNKTKNGVVVNGDRVTAYGLMVEHFHEYQTVWNGEDGKTFFYQSEIPYDVPNQAAWMSENGTVNGYASYYVAPTVVNHTAYGLGIYSYHRDATIDLDSVMTVSKSSGVNIYNVCSVMLAGNPGISHVINGVGGAVQTAGDRQQVIHYSGNETVVKPTVPSTSGSTVATTEPSTAPSASATQPSGANLALGKNGQASTGNAAAAFDGNTGSRWESTHGVDPSWIYVDLGSVSTVNSVVINWETAAAKKYQVQVSNDGNNWNTVYTENNGDAGIDTCVFNPVEARYVRVYGTERTTGYGYSIWELEVYGTAGQSTTSSTPGTSAPQTEPSTTPSTSATQPIGGNLALGKSGQASTGNAAAALDGNTGSRWESAHGVDPSWIIVDLGANYNVSSVVINWETAAAKSYQVQLSTDGNNWLTVYAENNGNAGIDTCAFSETEARYVKVLGTERTTQYGYSIWELEVYGSAAQSTTSPSTAPTTAPSQPSGNLALGKSGQASTGSAAAAFDGNTGSRWESAHGIDPSWIYVDLGSSMTFDKVVINWETAAAKVYQLQISDDAINWETVYTENNGDAGIDEITFDAVTARYVRMFGTQRTTGYGYSIWEMEVYYTGNANGVIDMPIVVDVVKLSTGKQGAVSSSEMGSAANVFDGNDGTRWSSLWQDEQWVYVDLGEAYNVSKVKLNWEGAYGKSYEIQVSQDAQNWSTVYTENNGNGGVDECNFGTVSARYVRMLGHTRGTGYGFSLWEMEVYGI